MDAERIRGWLTAPFGFTTVPVTTLAVVLYALLFSLVSRSDQLYDVPKDTSGLNVDRAYFDLHQITARPHPYLSHANDDVRTYLLSQLKPIVAEHEHVHLSDDLLSNASWVIRGYGVYFEGTNILVKIDGTDSSLSRPDSKPTGVLFSAHYDSVSTGPGATDDGMGIVTLLELVRYLSNPKHRPRRTAVFLFNNGEEDGLNGAYVYWKHPWSNLTSSFINLEGAASGGRPLLFRSTSLAPTRAFLSSAIRHLQADVVTGDAFKRGVIKSHTDYEVYALGLKGKAEPMAGLDVAFYKNRAYYHTTRDSVPGVGYGQGRKALWAMMEVARGAGVALLNVDETSDDNGQSGVYFDLLRSKLVLFSLHSLFVTNVIFLVIGPLTTFVLLVVLRFGTKKPSEERAAEQHATSGTWVRTKEVLRVLIAWSRFWVALILGVAAQIGVVAGYLSVNPYVVHAHPFLVLMTFLSLSFLVIAFPIQLLQRLLPSPPSSQKLAMLLEHYVFTWILLIAATVQVNKNQIGGGYWITAWNICAWLALSVAFIEGSVRARRMGDAGNKAAFDMTVDDVHDESNDTGRRFVSGVLYEVPEDPHHPIDEQEHSDTQGEIVETEPTEITPLMHQSRGVASADAVHAKYDEFGWWILQLLVGVPITALLLFQLELLQLQAMMNTLVDGSSPLIVYGALSVLSMFIFIPLAPFAHKLHYGLTLVASVLLVLGLVFSWTALPFTLDKPFKVFVQQQVEVDLPPYDSLSTPLAVNAGNAEMSVIFQQNSSNRVVRAVTSLTGLHGYVDRHIVRDMPSSWGKDVQCHEDTLVRPGLYECLWESELLPWPGGNETEGPHAQWIDVKTTRLNDTSAMIYVKGTNTRGCRLYFDKPISYYKIRRSDEEDAPQVSGTDGQFLPGYEMPAEGVKEVRLWTRTWERGFSVEFGWNGTENDSSSAHMQGRAACEWAEYASGSAGGSTPVARSGLIPALEEVKAFLPLWALPTKLTDGLVEVWTKFSI
ncbi:uncharacterized protein LAESUDRAFT_765215 [Laetiporus sulphureus 93-53]|uniref:Peptide hydrolase n=1 Tax=Laetiporus sulphureus 93-53 TaxID=1314785 RepID=A0A165AVX9_9APHY|nr:uncharacterized protein LAESUDRAFT_765215 [Laetiporus sulphureus 93-53]KZS99766.1 hypothetical protein LAESUDRAFT_765215 [Laetiporus sulphureus 93-53]